MEPLFEGLTASEIEYLKYLQERGYFDGIEMFINEDTSSDYRIEKLEHGGYIILKDEGPYDGSRFVEITGKGVAALVDYDKHKKQSSKSHIFKFLAWFIPLVVSAISAFFTYLQLSR